MVNNVLRQMTPSCNYPLLVSYEFVLQIVFCSLLCISGGKSFAKYLARLHLAVPMFGTIGRTGCSSTFNLPGQNPLGYKHKYFCCNNLFFIFRKIRCIFSFSFFVGS